MTTNRTKYVFSFSPIGAHSKVISDSFCELGYLQIFLSVVAFAIVRGLNGFCCTFECFSIRVQYYWNLRKCAGCVFDLSLSLHRWRALSRLFLFFLAAHPDKTSLSYKVRRIMGGVRISRIASTLRRGSKK